MYSYLYLELSTCTCTCTCTLCTCDITAKIATDPDYSIDNVLKFKDINGPDFSQGPDECMTCYAMEEILRNVKNTAPARL